MGKFLLSLKGLLFLDRREDINYILVSHLNKYPKCPFMPTLITLDFVRDKIELLQHALFFPATHSVLKMPIRIVRALEVDELGQIWFTIPSPLQQIREFDEEFPAKLDFFKKGMNYYLKVAGKAFLVTDPEEINSLYFIPGGLKELVRKNEMVLLKIKIQFADYFENIPKLSTGRATRFLGLLYKWVLKQQHGNGYVPRRSGPILLQGIISFPNNLSH
jgi:general stress protein 26